MAELYADKHVRRKQRASASRATSLDASPSHTEARIRLRVRRWGAKKKRAGRTKQTVNVP